MHIIRGFPPPESMTTARMCDLVTGGRAGPGGRCLGRVHSSRGTRNINSLILCVPGEMPAVRRWASQLSRGNCPTQSTGSRSECPMTGRCVIQISSPAPSAIGCRMRHAPRDRAADRDQAPQSVIAAGLADGGGSPTLEARSSKKSRAFRPETSSARLAAAWRWPQWPRTHPDSKMRAHK